MWCGGWGGYVTPVIRPFGKSFRLTRNIQGVSGGIVNILGGGSMDYSE